MVALFPTTIASFCDSIFFVGCPSSCDTAVIRLRFLRRPCKLRVALRKPNLLIYGFGYQFSREPLTVPGLSFLNGLRGSAQITNTNLFGKLYSGTLQARVGQDELLGQFSFQNPRPFGTNFPTLVSIFARRLAEKSFRSDRYTALIQAERRLEGVQVGGVVVVVRRHPEQ